MRIEDLPNVNLELPRSGLKEKLAVAKRENRPLIVKLGLDPTKPDIHLGHLVTLKVIREFLREGHLVNIIVGDFTAMIGDPSERNTTRPPLSKEEVRENARTYISQLAKVIDVNKVKILFNSEWLSKIKLEELIRILSKFNLAEILARDDFKTRFSKNSPIALHELIYPILQAYDSYYLKADIEIGGSDQLFNMQIGRLFQEALGQPPQVILTTPLLIGTDGVNKMSKSLNNYISFDESPNDIYAKVLAIPDKLIPDYINLVCEFSDWEKKHLIKELQEGKNPFLIKKEMAKNIISQIYDLSSAKKAEEYFRIQFEEKDFQEKFYTQKSWEELGLNKNRFSLLDLIFALGVRESKSEIRRLILQGAVFVNGEKIKDPYFLFKNPDSPLLVKAGQKDFFKII